MSTICKTDCKAGYPYLTADITGCGGTIKDTPDDFLVEEIPAYLPCGSGEHCYLTIEKRGITTLEAVRRIAQKLNLPERDVGYAGMKDAVGVTRQTISVQRVSPERASAMELDGVRVVSASMHTNKLKLGHLKGNRFRIAVRGVSADAACTVPQVLALLQRRGVPNYFGFQRYGAQGNSHLIGAALLRRDWQAAADRLIGEPDSLRDEQWRNAVVAYQQGDLELALQLFPRHCRSERDVLQRLVSRPGAFEKAFAAIHPRLKKLYLSAYQSFLFDQVVAKRIEHIDELMDGDLACKHVNGACFLVENAAAELERVRSFEISASGPLFGCRIKQPENEPLRMELSILENELIRSEDFDLPGGLRMEGARRPLRVPLGEPTWQLEGDCLRLEFSLPKGSYATSVLREITKNF
ncbi:MAG: tRNA pseudouridine(13) synthase TruD [Deltaproteobacteria bacterium]|nr:tRNA pseudouridine(13) synthase TruD [Deltaproteobacteria bacterium]